MACQKQPTYTIPNLPEKNQLNSLHEKRAYLRHHLKVGGQAIAIAMQNRVFKDALIKVLFSVSNEEHAINLRQIKEHPILQAYVDLGVLSDCLHAFTDLDGKDWHPSIRLNMPVKETRSGMLVLTNVYDPGVFADVYAVNEGWPEDQMPEVPAYEMINGELWPIDNFYLTEDNIEDQPVWVLELEESNIDPVVAGGIFGPPSCTNNSEPTFKSSMSSMTVKLRKEHFLAGRSDVHIMRGTTWKTANFAQNFVTAQPEIWNLGKTRKYKDYQGTQQVELCIADEDGDLIRKFKHKPEIRLKIEVQLSFSLIKSWKPIWGSDQDPFTYLTCNKAYCVIKGNIMYFTIFEFDAWPAPSRSVSIPNPAGNMGQSLQIQYRSWEDRYTDGFIDYVQPSGVALPTNIKGFNLSTDAIAFKTRVN